MKLINYDVTCQKAVQGNKFTKTNFKQWNIATHYPSKLAFCEWIFHSMLGKSCI